MRAMIGRVAAATALLLTMGSLWSASAHARPRCITAYESCAPCDGAAADCGGGYQLVEKTIYVPEVTWETRQVPVRVCKPEVRQVQVTVNREVVEMKPVTRRYTVMEVEQRTRTENYVVCKPVWKTVERQVTVMVPEQEVRQGVRQICRQVAVQETSTVYKDEGHWEERQVNVDSGCSPCNDCWGHRSRCGNCGGCGNCGCGNGGGWGAGCVTYRVIATVCRVWVPNLVKHEVPVTVYKNELVNQPFEYSVTVCKPLTKVVSEQVCELLREEKSRDVTFNVCVPKVVEKTEEVRVCRIVPEQVTRDVTVMVPSTEMREVRVPVCRMVEKKTIIKVPFSNNGCWGCAPCCN